MKYPRLQSMAIIIKTTQVAKSLLIKGCLYSPQWIIEKASHGKKKNKPFAKGLLICDNSCLFNTFFIKWKETTFYQLSLPYRKISHLSKVIWNTSSFGLLSCIINVEPIPKVGVVLKYSSFEVFDSNRSPLIMYLLPKLQSVVKSITVVY